MPRSLLRVVALLLLAAVAGGGNAVVCISANGHAAIEGAFPDCCVRSSASLPDPAAVEIRAAGEEHCAGCNDVLLAVGSTAPSGLFNAAAPAALVASLPAAPLAAAWMAPAPRPGLHSSDSQSTGSPLRC